MKYQIWHKRKITGRLVITTQLIVSVVISVIYKFPYVIHLIPLECEIHMIQVRLITIVLFILFACCIGGQIAVFVEAKKLLKAFPQGAPMPTASSGTTSRRNMLNATRPTRQPALVILLNTRVSLAHNCRNELYYENFLVFIPLFSHENESYRV